jgi:predicted HTH transcriptional regulator
LNKKAIGQFEAHLDQIIANAEGASAATSDPELEAAVTAAEATWVQEPTQAKPRTRENERSEVSRGEAERVRSTRHNTKQAEVIRLLQRPEGATIGQICAATGWQAHTVRGTLAGVIKRKLGLAIASTKDGKADRVYRIV